MLNVNLEFQIEAEGNDPVETGKSYGTPHDLASLYGKGRMYSDPTNVPDPGKICF